MKKLYKHCETCGGLTYMGEFCADLKAEAKQQAIEHLLKKHQIGDNLLMGTIEITENKIGRNIPREWPPQTDSETYLKIKKGFELGGSITKSHKEGDRTVIDDMDIFEFSITPNSMDDVDLPFTQITESSYKEKPYSYNDIKREEEEEEE